MPDFDWENFLGNIGQGLANNVGNTLNNVTSNPQLLPSLASAYQYMNQANRYGERGEQLAAGVDPWGQYRSGYAQKLNDLYNDPSSIANNPAYQFRLSQGMGKTASAAQAKNGGWGNEFAAMENYAQGLASTEYDAEVKRLMQLGGANLDPTNAAKIQLDADRNQIEAERAALGFLGTALAPQPVTNVTNNNTGGGTGGLGSIKPSDVANGILNGSNYGSTISAIYGGGQGALQAISAAMASGAKFIDLGNGQMIDLAAAARAMGGVDSPGNFGTYPTDGSIGNYGPETPIEIPTDPYVPIQDPGGFTPTDPMPDDYIYEGLNFWMQP